MQAKDISQKLNEQALEVAKYLLPNGKPNGANWRVGSIEGEPGQSLSVVVGGDNKGHWKDFATNEGGDLLDLWCVSRNINLSQAIKETKQWLGFIEPKFEPSYTKTFAKPILKNEPVLNTEVKNYLLNVRKIELSTLEKFKISSEQRNIIFPFYVDNQLLLVKELSLERIDGKKKISVTPNVQPCLFGWQAVNSNVRQITLCEGEIDTMSLYQYGINALSVPFGASNHQWLEHEFERLSYFDQIYLCFDQDTAGQKGVAALVERLGTHRCFIVSLPYKDANEALQQGMTQAAIEKCFQAAKSCNPAELKSAVEFRQQVKEEFFPSADIPRGYQAPFEKTHNKILFAPAELSIWTGTNGHGKSQFLGQVILSCMKQGAKVCIASLELKPKKLLMRLTKQASALSLPTEAYIDAIIDWYQDKLWIFDVTGNTKTERLLEVFLYARQRFNIDVFVIDSLMRCGIAEEDYAAQKSFVDKLCDFAKQHDCHIHLVAHARKGMDESKPPGKMDVKGTGAITDAADHCFTVWRNKHKEQELQKKIKDAVAIKSDDNPPDCLWICDKNRNNDWEGKVALWFDNNSYQYLSSSTKKPQRYVEFSTLTKTNL